MRKYIARKLVKLATWIYPQSPEVKKFYTKLMIDTLIGNGAITRIDSKGFYKPVNPYTPEIPEVNPKKTTKYPFFTETPDNGV